MVYNNLLSTDNVPRQMQSLRDLALLFSEISDDKKQDMSVRMECKTIARGLNTLSLRREVLTASCSVQQALSGYPIHGN